jgi:hypothetical protein
LAFGNDLWPVFNSLGQDAGRRDGGDRQFWIYASRWFPGWHNWLFIVKPETVLRWHRRRTQSTGTAWIPQTRGVAELQVLLSAIAAEPRELMRKQRGAHGPMAG